MTIMENPVVSVVNIINCEKAETKKSGSKVKLQGKAVLAEFISTTFLVFLGCMSCIPATGLAIHPPMYAPFGFGLAVLFNITAFGHISGAHMNPAVSLCAVLYGIMSIPLGIAYVTAQIAGAIAGYGLLVVVSPIDLAQESVCVTQPHPDQLVYQSLIIEVILTMALGFICCGVWDPVNADKNDAVPLKFGFTIAGLSLAGGFLTGASMNPARSLGPAIFTGNWNTHWVYWVGPMVGGAIAPIFYRLFWLQPKEKHVD